MRTLRYFFAPVIGAAIGFLVNLVLIEALAHLFIRVGDSGGGKWAPRVEMLTEQVVIFLLCGLAAGSVWGIWWTWDARLTTTLVLWLIYVSYLVLRRFAAGGQTQVLAAAFAIFGFADVPIVYMSIRWFRTQHPSPVMGGGENSGLAPAMLHVFLINLVAFTVLGILFVWLRYQLQMQEQALESAHAQLALKGVSR